MSVEKGVVTTTPNGRVGVERDAGGSGAPPSAPRRPTGTLWAWVGVVAGVCGVVGIQASQSMGAVYTEDIAGDAVAITAEFATQRSAILVMHLTLMVSAVLVVVFAAGLARRLRAALGSDSLLPPVAAWGLVLVAATTLLGTGLDTEFLFGLGDPTQMVPEVAAFASHWMGTIPWLWVGAGLSGVAVGVAGVRHRATATWLGWASIVLGGLALLVGVSPMQYLAGFVGPVWLVVAGVGFAVERR